MVSKKSFCLFLLVILFYIYVPLVFAQNTSSQFVQSIEWDSVDYAMHYTVVLEKKSALDTWELHETFEVTTNVLELTLGAGDYRYNVTVYNVFGRAEQASAWYGFTIEQALQPIVTDIFPKELDLKTESEDGEKAVIAINPMDVSEQATFFLQSSDGIETLYGEFIGYDENGMLQVEFETENLDDGNYELIIQDPSGLTSENVSQSSVLTVERSRPPYVNISLGYTYALFPPFENSLFSDYDFPSKNISGSAKVGYFPFVSPAIGSLGFELSSYVLKPTFTTESLKLSGFLFPVTFNVAYQKPLGKKFVFDAHLGAGATFLSGFMEYNTKTSVQDVAAIALNGGIAGQYFFNDSIFVELGSDYVFTYFLDRVSFHSILPTLFVGWKFD